jgi:hypothetical protein
MVLHRQLAVGALNLLVVSRAAHAEDFVIIAFYVGSQMFFLAWPRGLGPRGGSK